MEGTATYGTTGVEKNINGEIVDKGLKNSRKTIVFLVYCTLVMDNILLTVVGESIWLHISENYLSTETFNI